MLKHSLQVVLKTQKQFQNWIFKLKYDIHRLWIDTNHVLEISVKVLQSHR
jgi:hypothetical protein